MFRHRWIVAWHLLDMAPALKMKTMKRKLLKRFSIGRMYAPCRYRFEEEITMRLLHPILIVIGFRLRANALEGQKRFAISFLTTFALSAGLVLFPAGAKAAYVATELAVVTEATTRVVRGVNGSSEVVGGARLGSGRHQGFLLDGRVVPIGSIWGKDLPKNSRAALRTVPRGSPSKGSRVAITALHLALMISATSRERPILLPDCELSSHTEILPTLSLDHFPATPVAEPLALTLAER